MAQDRFGNRIFRIFSECTCTRDEVQVINGIHTFDDLCVSMGIFEPDDSINVEPLKHEHSMGTEKKD